MSAPDPIPAPSSSRAHAVVRLALHDRPLLREYISALRAGRRQGTADDSPPPDVRGVTPGGALAAVAAALGCSDVPAPGSALARVRAARRGEASDAATAQIAAGLAGDAALGEVVYALVRLTRPALVIETGVATGVTSAHALAALADNDHGQLTSVDLPPLALHVAGLVGDAVPADLRGRWLYAWGTSRRLLPGLLAGAAGELDVFVHDADHSYAEMHWELTSAWPALRPGGWLVSDDAHLHSAFADVARTVGADPIWVQQPGKQGLTGLLRKPLT